MIISPQQLLSLTNDSYMVANRFINSTYWPRSWMKWNVYSLTRTLIHSLTHIPCVYVVQSNSTPWVLAKDPPRKKHTKKKKEKKSPLWVLFVCLFVYFEHERKREKKQQIDVELKVGTLTSRCLRTQQILPYLAWHTKAGSRNVSLLLLMPLMTMMLLAGDDE